MTPNITSKRNIKTAVTVCQKRAVVDQKDIKKVEKTLWRKAPQRINITEIMVLFMLILGLSLWLS